MPDYHNGSSASKIERTLMHEFALGNLFSDPARPTLLSSHQQLPPNRVELELLEQLINPNRSGGSCATAHPPADGGFPAPMRGQIRDLGRYW